MKVDRVLLLEPRGFCAGVEAAVKALAWMVWLWPPPVFCVHEIVHNAEIVARFERLGVRFVDDVDDVPAGACVMLSAHGTAPDRADEASARAAVVVDAVCPLVAKVHHEVTNAVRAGDTVLYLGHEGHDEAEGVVGIQPDAVQLVGSAADAASAARRANPTQPISLLAQTTLSLDEWAIAHGAVRAVRPDVRTPPRQDVCYATTNRQRAVRAIAPRCDAVVVVGSATSSNTQALARTAREAGIPSVHRVEDADELPALVGTVAVTAGASAPEYLVEDVVRRLAPAAGVEVVTATTEGEYFRIPRPIRSAVEHANANNAVPADLVEAYNSDRRTPATAVLTLVERHLQSLVS